MTAKIDNVPMGKVVLLLRTIRKQYYRETIATKSQLRERLHNIQLSDFKVWERNWTMKIYNTIY